MSNVPKLTMETLIRSVKDSVIEANEYQGECGDDYLIDIVESIVPQYYGDIADVLLSDVSLGLESSGNWEECSCIWDAITFNIYEALMEVAVSQDESFRISK